MTEPGQDLIEGGGRRRGGAIGVIASVAVLGVAAIVLAGRPESALPRPAPTPTAASTPPTLAESQILVDVAVGPERIYALLGVCRLTASEECRYQLKSMVIGTETWSRQPVPIPALTGTEGFSARLLLARSRTLMVVDDLRNAVYVVRDDGGVAKHAISLGPPLAAVPDGLVVEDRGRLEVLDPATGWRRPLATQPPVELLGAVATGEGGEIWVAGQTAAGVFVVAVSLDRGRTWQPLPLRGLRPGPQLMHLVPVAGRLGAYLIVGRDELLYVREEFSELWRIGDPSLPGEAWRRMTLAADRPRSAASAVRRSDGGLLVAEENGGVWRIGRDGTASQQPVSAAYGDPIMPTNLRRGPGASVVAQPSFDSGQTVLLYSERDGEDWTVLVVPRG